jgi:hypothetical protein
MILEAAETVLGYFSFDRSVYGDKRNTGNKEMEVATGAKN